MNTQAVQSLFTVVFEDDSIFKGGENYKETKWLEIPNKKIKRLFYKLPHGDYFCLSGYEKYYHFIEATKDLNGKRKGEERLEYVYLMGKLGNKVIVYKISLKNGGNYMSRYKLDGESDTITALNINGWR